MEALRWLDARERLGLRGDLKSRPSIVRARYLMYLADLVRTDYLPTAWVFSSDDDGLSPAIYKRVLEGASPGWRVEGETETAAAFARVRAPDFDLFMTDQSKPGGSGTGLITELRAHRAGSYVPAAMVSATFQDPVQAPALEIDLVVGKPWKLDTLRNSLRLLFPGPGDAERLSQADLSDVWTRLA